MVALLFLFAEMLQYSLRAWAFAKIAGKILI